MRSDVCRGVRSNSIIHLTHLFFASSLLAKADNTTESTTQNEPTHRFRHPYLFDHGNSDVIFPPKQSSEQEQLLRFSWLFSRDVLRNSTKVNLSVHNVLHTMNSSSSSVCVAASLTSSETGAESCDSSMTIFATAGKTILLVSVKNTFGSTGS